MSDFAIYTGKNLTKEKYLATWELDNLTFGKKDQLTKKLALEWFEYSNRSTIVLWDNESDTLVGYITPYLLSHQFSSDYILSDKTYKESLIKEVFVAPQEGVDADIYLFSVVVVEKYRNMVLEDSDLSSIGYKKTAIKVLTEALVDWICDVKEKGVSINYVFGEKVSPDGEKYLKSLGMQPCLTMIDDCKFAKLFTPSMFSKCSNVDKLFELYSNEKLRKPFEKQILNNHEYLSIKDNALYFKDINLKELVDKYNAPLEVAYTPIITEKIKNLKGLFADKIAKYKYPAKYNYAYATKANYYSEVVLTALNDVDMLETSSAYDIEIIY